MARVNKSDSIVITRANIGHWASYIGGVGLLLGLLGWIWQGGTSPIITGLLIVGAAGVLLWVVMNPREFTALVTGRQVRYSTMAVFSTLLLIGVVALTYILLQRSAITLDMTLANRFSLSPESLDVLKSVNRPMQITAFYSSTGLQMREIDDQFYRLYETATNNLITRRYINPDEEPAQAQRFGAYSNGATFLSYLNEDGSVDFSTLSRVPRAEDGAQEREMTQAISRMLIAGSIKVYFEIGHAGLDPLDTSQQGLSGIHFGMQESGLLTDSLDLTQIAEEGGRIPEDAGALILARPAFDLNEAEIGVIDDYLSRGGGLFIMADAIFGEGAFMKQESAFNNYLWTRYGVRTIDAVIVDYAASSGTPLDIMSAAVYGATSIGDRLDPATTPTIFRIARAVQVQTENAPVNNGRVITSSPDSYGETDFQSLFTSDTYEPDVETDLPGPLDSAVWAWDQTTDARILLIGDSDFVTNGFVSTTGNAILFTDGMAWLSGLDEEIEFAPQGFAAGLPLMFISTQQLDLIALFTVFVMPGAVLLAGLLVWLRRARR